MRNGSYCTCKMCAIIIADQYTNDNNVDFKSHSELYFGKLFVSFNLLKESNNTRLSRSMWLYIYTILIFIAALYR